DTLDGFFIHLDADSLSDTVMPAVDYRLPDGLTPDELEVTLRTAIERRCRRARGDDLQPEPRSRRRRGPRAPRRADARPRHRGPGSTLTRLSAHPARPAAPRRGFSAADDT